MKKIVICQSKSWLQPEDYYSKVRLSGYDSLEAYYYDIELSEAFYPALRTIEIVLRNSLWHSISSLLNRTNWLIDDSVLHHQELKIITETQEKIKRHYPSRIHENDHLISELSFGFWTNLLNARYEQIFWPKGLRLFVPYIPRKHCYRDFLDKRLVKIRELRNRIFHHQRICRFRDIDLRHQEILEMIGWIEPTILAHLRKIDRFEVVYQKELIKFDME